MASCFVVQGFGKKTDFTDGRVLDLDASYAIIKEAVEGAELECIRADEIVHSGTIDAPMYKQLLQADLVIADLSTYNVNAAFELGVRYGLRPRATIIVAEEDCQIIGWGSLSRFHPRQAYCHSVEDSVYLHHEHQGKGLGSLLLSELIELAKQIGHHTVLGGIDADQQASIALHAKFGFEKVSHLKEVGYKQGRWLDVIWMQKML